MHFLPQQFVGVNRTAHLVFVTENNYALHLLLAGDVEQLANQVGRIVIVLVESASHLNPATAQAQRLGLQLNVGGSYGAIFHPNIGLARVATHHNGKFALCHRSSAASSSSFTCSPSIGSSVYFLML